MREKTRKHLRATLAATCALSLAASLAFPLAAMAQAGATEEAAQLPATDTLVADAPAEGQGPARADASGGDLASSAGETAADAVADKAAIGDALAEAPAPTGDQPTGDELVSADSLDGSPASAAAQRAALPETETPAAAGSPENRTATNEETNPPAETADQDIGEDQIQMLVESPTGSSIASALCYIPSGSTIAEARAALTETSVGREDILFFYQLGTDATISVGDRYPSCPGYTFQGWINQLTGESVTEDTPLSGYPVRLITSWKKDGSNIDFVSRWEYRVTYHLVMNVVPTGMLSGPNVPVGADILLDANCNPRSGRDDFEALRECMTNAGIESKNTFEADISLLVDGKAVHDGFGTMTLTFYPGVNRGPADGDTLRIWHKHQDGSITCEDVKFANGAASIEVTDLSLFGVGILGKDDTQPGDDQKPGGDGGNQGTQQPGGNNDGGDKKDEGNNKNDGNGDKKDEGNKNDNGDDKKTDDGKQGGSGDKGNNKNGGNLAKTGDEMRYALGGTMAALTIALFTGGTALLMGNRKRPAHRHR